MGRVAAGKERKKKKDEDLFIFFVSPRRRRSCPPRLYRLPRPHRLAPVTALPLLPLRQPTRDPSAARDSASHCRDPPVPAAPLATTETPAARAATVLAPPNAGSREAAAPLAIRSPAPSPPRSRRCLTGRLPPASPYRSESLPPLFRPSTSSAFAPLASSQRPVPSPLCPRAGHCTSTTTRRPCCSRDSNRRSCFCAAAARR